MQNISDKGLRRHFCRFYTMLPAVRAGEGRSYKSVSSSAQTARTRRPGLREHGGGRSEPRLCEVTAARFTVDRSGANTRRMALGCYRRLSHRWR